MYDNRTLSANAPGGSSLTLARGLRVLRTLAANPDGISVTELATDLGTHRTGIYRLLGPLVDERLAVRRPDGTYTLGLGVLELAGAVRPRLREVAVPILRALADELRATAALTIRDGDEAVVAAVVEPTSVAMRIAYAPGLRHPVDRAAPGLAILAGGPPLPGERDEVARGRERGWTLSSGEILPGATGIAAPIAVPGEQETEASISAVWIDARDPADAAGPVMRAATAIAEHL